ncbi:MAG: PQQ-binding-like beta-propeller repeat protein [Myxococcota bacterium]|nr:PQQ-binding-like beta-propeller repeat protein [Myxococcota bacterium]
MTPRRRSAEERSLSSAHKRTCLLSTLLLGAIMATACGAPRDRLQGQSDAELRALLRATPPASGATRQAAEQLLDERAWEVARSQDEPASYRRYVRSAGLGVFKDEAEARHDQQLWRRAEEQGDWGSYIERCLACEKSEAARAELCRAGAAEFDLLSAEADAWVKQCEGVDVPEVKALLDYRKMMGRPEPEMSPSPWVDALPPALAARFRARLRRSQAQRLLGAAPSLPRLEGFLRAEIDYASDLGPLWGELERYRDKAILPCLARPLGACAKARGLSDRLEIARKYLRNCRRCDDKARVERLLADAALYPHPVFSFSHDQRVFSSLDETRLVVSAGARASAFDLDQAARRGSAHRWSWRWRDGDEWRSPRALDPFTPQNYHRREALFYAASEWQLSAIDIKSGRLRWQLPLKRERRGGIERCERHLKLTQGWLCLTGDRARLFDWESGEERLLQCGNQGCRGRAWSSKNWLVFEDQGALYVYDLSPPPENEGEPSTQTSTAVTASKSTLSPRPTFALPKRAKVSAIYRELLFLSEGAQLIALDLSTLQTRYRLRDRAGAPLIDSKRSQLYLRGKGSASAYELATGRRLWRQRLSPLGKGDLRLFGEQLILPARRGLISLDRERGTLQWRLSLQGEPTQIEQLQPRQLIVAEGSAGRLAAYSLESGALRWRFQERPFNHFSVTSKWLALHRSNGLRLFALRAAPLEPLLPLSAGLQSELKTGVEGRRCLDGELGRCAAILPALTSASARSLAEHICLLGWIGGCRQLGLEGLSLGLERVLPMPEQEATDQREAPESDRESVESLIVASGGLPPEERMLPKTRPRSLLRWSCGWGDIASCESLAVALQRGIAGPQSASEARVVFEQAISMGSLDAQLKLGQMLAEGEGGTADPSAAARLFEQTCQSGEARGCAALAESYLSGHGRPRSLQLARRFFSQSCTAGHAPACARLDEMQARPKAQN